MNFVKKNNCGYLNKLIINIVDKVNYEQKVCFFFFLIKINIFYLLCFQKSK